MDDEKGHLLYKEPLKPPATTTSGYGATTTASATTANKVESSSATTTTPRFNRLRQRAWSIHGEYEQQHQNNEDSNSKHSMSSSGVNSETRNTIFNRILQQHQTIYNKIHDNNADDASEQTTTAKSQIIKNFIYYIVYAIVNVIISVPGLIGYAAVIFSHPVFTPHMNALAKLVILSSFIHQLSFTLFSSLPFAIGTVQDAGLIFLSSMSNQIATTILARENGTEEQVLSTAMVLLSLGTASLGLILMAMGHFRLADAVSYLPMPVVGGYLAFIGYFCLEAGVGLSVSKSMTEMKDWVYLHDMQTLLLATPALLTGLILTWLSRNAQNDAALPLAMVIIPCIFYIVIAFTGIGLDGAREAGWVGEIAPPVPVSQLFSLVDFSLVQWDLIAEILPTWVGMVLVVSFASCLDVAAIAMDMGEALDTNKELATVGIGNLMSGLTLGYTGSYIFSQTIFTYRTGVHSRWIGIFIMIVFAYVVASPVNILQVAPLFFLGSTLIFIGYDLLYEWLIEIREKIFLSEYIIVLCTFIAIQIVGMDAGIMIGVLVAIVDHVVHSAKILNVYRMSKRSRAVWTPEEQKILQDQGYHPQQPKIVTLEIVGSVFFGSSLALLQRILEELGISMQQDDKVRATPPLKSPHTSAVKSPHTASHFLVSSMNASGFDSTALQFVKKRNTPKYLVIDLTKLHNLDASASRGCFLQLVKICSKRGITVCACGAGVRVEWMLRSHDVAYSVEKEHELKMLFPQETSTADSERLLLFVTIHEALAFCENLLIRQMGRFNTGFRDRFTRQLSQEGGNSLSDVFAHTLGSSVEERNILMRLDGKRYHSEIFLNAAEVIFSTNAHSDAFYVILKGNAAVAIGKDDPRHNEKSKRDIISGAGLVRRSLGSSSDLLDPSLLERNTLEPIVLADVWPVGAVLGYVDFLLERPRHFRAVAASNDTVVAKISHSDLQLMQNEDPILDGLVQRVLLQASLLDLANCTCGE